MYPVLFKIGSIEIQSYYVIWSVALCAAMIWTNKRIDKSGLPIGESTSVITWSFAAMLFGARFFEYIWNWREYFNNPSLLLDLDKGGLSEVSAVGAAVIAAYFLCRAKKISFWQFSDTVSPAILLTIAIGRWGCYLNGCCGGQSHATQLYYSFSGAATLALVLAVENYFRRAGRFFKYGIISPIGLGLYAMSRLIIDPLRVDYGTGGMAATRIVLVGGIVVSMIWIGISCHKISTNRC